MELSSKPLLDAPVHMKYAKYSDSEKQREAWDEISIMGKDTSKGYEFFPAGASGRKVRVFSLKESFLEGYKALKPAWGPVGYFTFKRTYARHIDPDDQTSRTEEWWETCRRVVEGVFNIQKVHCKKNGLPWSEPKSQRSAQEMYDRMFNFKWLPPGRGLWTMGTDIVYEKGSACLNNCAFVSTENIDVDFAGPFCFLMDMSMLGVGVGGDCKGSGKVRLIPRKISDVPYVVEDSREGWVDLISVVLNSFVGRGAYPRFVDYSKVRPFGSPIRGFGGVASGPDPLEALVESLTNLLSTDVPVRITSSQIVDIFNLIGKCVVAGNVRRTAEIMFGNPDDEEFSALKDPTELNNLQALLSKFEESEDTTMVEVIKEEIKNHPLRSHRWASNNSVFGTIGMDYSAIAEKIAKNGEPGIIWLDSMRKYGRMADPANNKDQRVMGSNPCSEQSLESYELCCLVESFPAHHETLEDYLHTLKYAFLYAKTVTLVPTHDIRTNAVMMRNKRIGCSMSGIIQAITKIGRREFLQWCDNGYKRLKELDTIYSEWLCVAESRKITSVKPSGTVSLLCGATPGIHHPHSEYYIRNIRVQDGSPLVQAARDAGYPVEEDSYGTRSWVVSFPVKERMFTKGKSGVTIWEQFSNAAALQKWWADNQVSVTVTFTKEEADDIQTCLEVYEDQLKSVSLLPLNDHGYVQAPYIEISKEKYEELIGNITEINLNNAKHEITEKFCDGDSCTISY